MPEKYITQATAKIVLREMFLTGKDPVDIINEHNLWEINDRVELEGIVDQVIRENPRAVAMVNSSGGCATSL